MLWKLRVVSIVLYFAVCFQNHGGPGTKTANMREQLTHTLYHSSWQRGFFEAGGISFPLMASHLAQVTIPRMLNISL
jgi:hypothetical protein